MDVKLSFSRNATGQITSVHMRQNGADIVVATMLSLVFNVVASDREKDVTRVADYV